MWCELSARGMRIAQKHKLEYKDFIAFCPNCWWEAPEKNAAYGSLCPECHKNLHVVREGYHESNRTGADRPDKGDS